jgi:hypothetical protein
MKKNRDVIGKLKGMGVAQRRRAAKNGRKKLNS